MTDIITGGFNDTHMIYIDGKKNNVIKNVDFLLFRKNYIEKIKKYEFTK